MMRAVRRNNATGIFSWIGSDGWSARNLVSDGNEPEVCIYIPYLSSDSFVHYILSRMTQIGRSVHRTVETKRPCVWQTKYFHKTISNHAVSEYQLMHPYTMCLSLIAWNISNRRNNFRPWFSIYCYRAFFYSPSHTNYVYTCSYFISASPDLLSSTMTEAYEIRYV